MSANYILHGFIGGMNVNTSILTSFLQIENFDEENIWGNQRIFRIFLIFENTDSGDHAHVASFRYIFLLEV